MRGILVPLRFLVTYCPPRDTEAPELTHCTASAIVSAMVSAFCILALLLSMPTFASWPADPTASVPVCTEPGHQLFPNLVSDGAGGVIVAWDDERADGGLAYAAYAHHIMANGEPHPAWPIGGLPLEVAESDHAQPQPRLVSDGYGGAIVTWIDRRNGQWNIQAHHVLAGGIDPLWIANGRTVCPSQFQQYLHQSISDGAGGVIVTWIEDRGGGSDVYSQRVLANGQVDPSWPVSGRALSTGGLSVQGLHTVEDGSGGAIATWFDYRTGNPDIYAQHVLANGELDPLWPVDGRAVCTAPRGQYEPRAVSDGAGGAIVTWSDLRSLSGIATYAQHVLSGGTIDPAWPTNGIILGALMGGANYPKIVSDGAGGAIVTWDGIVGSGIRVYAQRVLAGGIVDPAWPSQGLPVCAVSSEQTGSIVVQDGAGGAIVTWMDDRHGNGVSYDMYVQHLLPNGTIDPAWPASGRALFTAADASDRAMVADGAGGAIVVWRDFRSGTNWDVHVQRVNRFGMLGDTQLPVDVDFDPDVLNLSSSGRWLTAYVEPIGFDPTTVDISTVRLAASVLAEAKFGTVGDHDGDQLPDLMVKFSRAAVVPLLTPGSNQLEVTGTLTTGEPFAGTGQVTVTYSGNDALSLQLVSPLGLAPVEFVVRESGTADQRVAVYDVQGRRLAEWGRPVSTEPISWDGRGETGQAGSGIYFIRVTEGTRAGTLKVLLAR